MNNALAVVQGFSAGKRLQQAAIQYIVMNLSSDKEIMELELAYRAINVSQSGKLSVLELVGAFGAESEEEKEIVTSYFYELDIDRSGYVEFTEWLVASINKRTLITEEKLELAFKLFDKDGGGTINAHEVRTTLIGDATELTEIEEKIWNDVIDEVDIDGSGSIDFDEFQYMIKKLVCEAEPTLENETILEEKEYWQQAEKFFVYF